MTTRRRPLTDDERREQLATCPEWHVVSSPLPDDASGARTELCRAFRFRSFDEALAFMQAAAPFINHSDHHPRWENSHRTVTVALTTWDAGQSITLLDVELARHLDGLFAQFSAPR